MIPSEWVEASLKPYIESSFTPGYGYQWWIAKYQSPDESMWVPSAVGNGGQFILILRPLNMTVVITGGNYNADEAELGAHQTLTDYVYPAAGMTGMAFVPVAEQEAPRE